MKRDDYVNAMNRLEFSDDLAAKILEKAECKCRYRFLRTALLAAVLGCFMLTTAFGAVSVLRQRPTKVVPVGSDLSSLAGAKPMKFTLSEMVDDVAIQYLQLNPAQQYHFRHGMLWSNKQGYVQITEDYLLEPVQMNRAELELKKNDRVYVLSFDYLASEVGVISNHRSIYHTDENGEILLNPTDGNSGQWPVYFHVETGSIRDALPGWTASNFDGQVVGGIPLMGGILITTVEDENPSDAHNVLYWIAAEGKNKQIIELPGKGNWDVGQDTFFYQNEAGQLYRMNQDFQFEMLCAYETMDYLQDGLLTVCAEGKLGILDAYRGELYVVEEIPVTRDDTRNYRALRYGAEGNIALVQTQWKHDPQRHVLCMLGMLDKESMQLKVLQIGYDFDGYLHGWLGENRFAVVYQSDLRQYLCVYEFD